MLINSQPHLTVCGEASDQTSALYEILVSKPDIAIVDLNLGDDDGIELIQRLKDRNDGMKFLVFTMHNEPQHISRAMKAGAHGYLLKEEGAQMVIPAINLILKNKTFLREVEKAHERINAQLLDHRESWTACSTRRL